MTTRFMHMSDDSGWHKPAARSRPTFQRAARRAGKFVWERLPGTRPYMERRARRRDEAELRAEQAVGLLPPKKEDSEHSIIVQGSSAGPDSSTIDKDRVDEVYTELIGGTSNGGPYRSNGALAEDRQDELAKEFGKDLVFHFERLSLFRRMRAFYLNISFIFFTNVILSAINILLPRKLKLKLAEKFRDREVYEHESEMREALKDKRNKAFELLKSSKITSGRAQYLLATEVDEEQAKELLLGSTVTNEVAQVELAEKLWKGHARELLASGKQFNQAVDGILREKANLPSLPPKSKD